MLERLDIENIALVDRVSLTFDTGLSVLTGETGAGKSVIVNALSLVLGQRADRDAIRHGCDTATVTATFDVSGMSNVYRQEFADFIADDTLTIRREILRDGQSKARVNGMATPLGGLREITMPIAEILGQHANQALLDDGNHLGFLDHFADVEELRENVANAFGEYDRLKSELADVIRRRDSLKNERELLLFQRNEIENAHISVGEEAQLEAERKRLDAARELMQSAQLVLNVLDGEESSLLRQAQFARRELERMAESDSHLAKLAQQLAETQFIIEDTKTDLSRYGDALEDNPQRLEEINQRLDELYKLKAKYGGSEEAILTTLVEIDEQLGKSPDSAKLIDYLEKEVGRAEKLYTEKARQLSEIRRKAADYLERLVVKELAALAIEQAQFVCAFDEIRDSNGIDLGDRTIRPQPHGFETVRFEFSANYGEPAKPLAKTASGGEISRVLLAIKAAEKRNASQSLGLLVFDEVDTGIGGRTAAEVGQRLKKLAEGHQVLVITHLHQIARLADHHYVAEKSRSADDRSVIAVRRLTSRQVASELDRMLALPSHR